MNTPCGAPRKLTDRQIVQVLNWHQEAIEFRLAHGTVRDLARVLSASLHSVRGCFAIQVPVTHSPARPGRPRHLTPVQIAFVLAWRSAGCQFRDQHGTVESLARTLGVGKWTIHDCIRRKGRYTQSTHVTMCQAAGRASPPRSDAALRAALLRAWSRPWPKR
jgi:hypothetical protein